MPRKRGNGEGSIYPIKDKQGHIIGYRGSYWVHTAAGRKRRYLSGKKREDVRDKLAKALSDRADGLVFDAGVLTVGEYLDRWLKDVEDTVRRSTYEGYEYAIKPHIRPALGRIKLKDLSPPRCGGSIGTASTPDSRRRRCTSCTSSCTRP
jgi:integrase